MRVYEEVVYISLYMGWCIRRRGFFMGLSEGEQKSVGIVNTRLSPPSLSLPHPIAKKFLRFHIFYTSFCKVIKWHK
jgi:hypothetical protein